MVTVSGVKSIKYSLFPEQTFSNSEPGCYNGDNLSFGVHNSTGCKGGDTTLKTFVSLPHFLRADPAFVNQFTQGVLNCKPILEILECFIFLQEVSNLKKSTILPALQFRRAPPFPQRF